MRQVMDVCLYEKGEVIGYVCQSRMQEIIRACQAECKANKKLLWESVEKEGVGIIPCRW